MKSKNKIPSWSGAAPEHVVRRLGWVLLSGGLVFGAHAQVQHVVRPGDTLWSIAARYAGAPTQWQVLQRANRLTDPHQLRVGQSLQVPASLVALPVAEATVRHVIGEAWITMPAPRSAPQRVAVGSVVPEGAHLRVADDGLVRLQLPDGSAISLSPGSRAWMMRLRRHPDTQQAQTQVRMEAGRIESDVVPRRHPASRFEVHTPMAVASVRGTQFGVSVGAEGASSDVSEGEVAMAARGRRALETALQSGDGAHVDVRGQLRRVPMPAAPKLTGPEGLFTDGDEVSFAWNPADGSSVDRVRLLPGDRADQVLRERTVPQPSVRWDGLEDGAYVLMVQHQHPLGLLGHAATHRFDVRGWLAPPLHRQPAPGESVDGPVVSLWCSERTLPVTYRAQVSRHADFAELVWQGQSAQACRFDVPLPPGTYHWRVATAADDGSGLQGHYSTPQPFEVRPTAGGIGTDTPHPQAPALQAHWAPRPGLSYRVQVARDPQFAQLVFDDWVERGRITLPDSADGTHYLRWQTRDAQGRLSRYTAAHRLEVQQSGLRTGDGQPVRSIDPAAAGVR